MLDYHLDDIKDDAGGIASGLGIYGELQHGGTVNDTKAAAGATSLAGKTGIFGDNTSGIEGAAGDVTNGLGIVTGIEAGGVKGYASAVANAGQLGARLGAFGAESPIIGEAAGVVAAGLSVYSFVENWQSGDTGGDAIRGAEAGAAVGSVIPVVGTLAGAVIGGAIGAVSSMFGPGKQDPESAVWDQYAAAYATKGASGVSGATASQNFQLLAGIFDSRGGGANAIPFYAKYGRMGEAGFTADMTTQINSAIAKGTITANTPPSQVYSSVVLPWINSMEPGKNMSQVGNTSKGVPTAGAIQNVLTTMIGQYQSGQLTGSTKLGINGQQISQITPIGSMGGPPNTQQIQKTVQQNTSTFNSSVTGFPMGAAGNTPSDALAGMALVMPHLFLERG